MAVVFPRADNPNWPLPKDYYTDLTKDGQRMARVNACSLRGRPDLEVAAWWFFRSHYLFPLPPGAFYKHGHTKSPPAHYKWVYDWAKYDRTVHAAPRGSAKSTLVREEILRHVLTRPHWEVGYFLSKQAFITTAMDIFMGQIETNALIVDDFGKMKPPRGAGSWNHSQLKLNNGAMVTGVPITGACMGLRPHEIFFDDVEKDDSIIVCPTDLSPAFRNMLFNVIEPMVGRWASIRIIGTLFNRRTFIYWLRNTTDKRITDFYHRTLLNIVDMKWDSWMGEEFQAEMKERLGPAAWAAQYMNDPGTEEACVFQLHSELHTYTVEDRDDAYETAPLLSKAKLVAHQVADVDEIDGHQVVKTRRVERVWGEVVAGMRRIITVDYASTTHADSDFSAVHVLGFENQEGWRDVLWSLDLKVVKMRPEELIRLMYQMALKWNVTLIGVEAYAVQAEFYNRAVNDLPQMFGGSDLRPRVFPIKWPTNYAKAEKIMSLEYRFKQYKIRLPSDRPDSTKDQSYSWDFSQGLFYQIVNFTEDMALLSKDDALDTLAMSSKIGGARPGVGIDIVKVKGPMELLAEGQTVFEGSGIPVMSGINASQIPPDVLQKLMAKRWEGYTDPDHIDLDEIKRLCGL